MRVALIGPPFSGKTTLFEAIAAAGGSTVDVSRADQPHLAVARLPDERLKWLAEHYQTKKVVPAELEVLDMPGVDLSDPAAREHWRRHWSEVRDCAMTVLVVRDFADPSVAAYRGRVDAAADAAELIAEMLFADLDQVTGRIERLQEGLQKPKKPAERDAIRHELELMTRLRDALENERPAAEAVHTDAEAKLLRSFALLSLKPQLVVRNCDEGDAARADETIAGVHAMSVSAKIERELAQLDPADRGEFLADLNLTAPARDRLLRHCFGEMSMITMLTAGAPECRAWPLPAGTDAVTAAGEIHSDIARGFIRAETTAFEDLRAAGDIKAVKAAGKLRLEGKHYVVRDGDVINFRFNV